MNSINRKFNEKEIDSFIEISGDNAKFHSSKSYANSKGLKNRICHGIMTLMPVSKILGEILPGEGHVILELNSKFHNPVLPGEDIIYRYECIADNSSLGTMKISIKAKNKLGNLKLVVEALCKRI